MSPELIGIITVGVGLFSANLVMMGFLIFLINQSERRTNQRIDRLEERMEREFQQLRAEMNQGFAQLRAEVNQDFAQLRAEMNQGFAQQDIRIRNLEQGQAYMSGQFSELKDYFSHRSEPASDSQSGD